MCNVYMCMGLVQGLAREYTFTSHCHTLTHHLTPSPPHTVTPTVDGEWWGGQCSVYGSSQRSESILLPHTVTPSHTTSHPHPPHPHIPNSHHLTPSHTTSHHLTPSPPHTVTPTVYGEWWGGQCSVYGSSQRSSWGRQGCGRAH